MEKKLIDYLHLYKGCEMLCTNKDCNDDLEYYGRKSKLSLILLGTFNNGNWKPILRPLSSMTDDEVKELTKVMLGKEPDICDVGRFGDDYIQSVYKLVDYDISNDYDTIRMELHICSGFRILNCWVYLNSKSQTNVQQPLHNSHEVARYLLSLHFDLFGLIPAGLAIDKTTLS